MTDERGTGSPGDTTRDLHPDEPVAAEAPTSALPTGPGPEPEQAAPAPGRPGPGGPGDPELDRALDAALAPGDEDTVRLLDPRAGDGRTTVVPGHEGQQPPPGAAPAPPPAAPAAPAAARGPGLSRAGLGMPPREPRGVARPGARRRARLAVSRVDPWSVFVLSLVVSICLGVVLVVALVVLYSLLDGLGVLGSVNTFAADLGFISQGDALVGLGQVVGVGLVLAVVDVVLLTVLATLYAFLYNLCASLTGGVEVTLTERE